MSVNSFDARRTLDVDGQSYEIYDVTKVDGCLLYTSDAADDLTTV